MEIFNESSSRGIKLNGLMGEISLKEKSGSVGIRFSLLGTKEDWLCHIFESELYLTVNDKPKKNIN